MGASMGVEGATDNKEVFETYYVEHFLVRRLTQGQVVVVVVMDKLGAHRTRKVREIIEERGAELWLLASYSSQR